jgi:cytochrome c
MKLKMAFIGIAGMLTLGASAAFAGIEDAKALELMKSAGCAACHTVDKKLVGPMYKDVAAKRKGEADAIATLEKSVRTGSKGTYGQIPMPPTPPAKISDGDLRSLLEWILSR